MAEGGDSFDFKQFKYATVPDTGGSHHITNPANRSTEFSKPVPMMTGDELTSSASQHDQSRRKPEICIQEAWSDVQIEFVSESRKEVLQVHELYTESQPIDDVQQLPRRLQYLVLCSERNLYQLARLNWCEMKVNREQISFQVSNFQKFDMMRKNILHGLQMRLSLTCEISVMLSKKFHVDFNAEIKNAGLEALKEGMVVIFDDSNNKDYLVVVGQDSKILRDTVKSVKSFAAQIKGRASSLKVAPRISSDGIPKEQEKITVEETLYQHGVDCFCFWEEDLKARFPDVKLQLDDRSLVMTGSRENVDGVIAEVKKRIHAVRYDVRDNLDNCICNALCKDHTKQYIRKKLHESHLQGTYLVDREKRRITFYGKDEEEVEKVKQVMDKYIIFKEFKREMLDHRLATQTLQDFKNKIAMEELDTETFKIACTVDVMGELARKLESCKKLYDGLEKQRHKQQSQVSGTESGISASSEASSNNSMKAVEPNYGLQSTSGKGPSGPEGASENQQRSARANISPGTYRLLKRLGMKEKISLQLEKVKKVSQWHVDQEGDRYILLITRVSQNLNKGEDCLRAVLNCIKEVPVERAIFEEAKKWFPSSSSEYEVSEIKDDLNYLCITALTEVMEMISPVILRVQKRSQGNFVEHGEQGKGLQEGMDDFYFQEENKVKQGSGAENFTGGIVPLKSVEMEYLLQYKRKDMEGIREEHGVTISETSEHDGFLIQGKGDITSAKRDIMDLVHFKMERFNVDVGQVKEEKLRKVTHEQEDKYKSKVEVDLMCDDEPEYLCSWLKDGGSLCIVLCYGSIENSKADMIVCPCNVAPYPHGEISENILKKGGKEELREDLQGERKKFAKKRQLGDVRFSVGDVLFGATTGNLNCVSVAYPIIPEWSLDKKIDDDALGKMAEKIIDKMNTDGLRSVVFPVDFSRKCPVWQSVAFFIVNCFMECSNKPKHRMEIQFCTKSFDDASRLQQKLAMNIFSDKRIEHYVVVDQMIRFNAIPSEGAQEAVPLAVDIVKSSLIDAAPYVDVIVNSTDCKLELKNGRVSASILKRGGEEIQRECNKKYPNGIPFGEVATTCPGKLNCKMICHTALLEYWIPDGNFSLKVLRALMMRCLQISDQKGFRSIAFPALGTGKLAYPWYLVARTMYDVVDEYGKRRTKKNLQKVSFVIHHTDLKTLEAFEFVQKSRQVHATTKIPSGTSIEYFETRIPTSGYKFQVMTENAFRTNPIKPECQLRFQKQNVVGGTSVKHLDWSIEENCCLLHLLVDGTEKSLRSAIEEALRKIQELRLTSIAIMFPTHCGYEAKWETVEAMKEFIPKYFEKSFISSLMGSYKDDEILYLREVQICLLGETSSFLEQEKQKSWSQRLNLFSSTCSTKWTRVSKSFGQCFDVQIASGNPETTERILRELQRWIYGVDESEYTGKWCLHNPKDKNHPILLQSYCIDQLNKAVRNRKSTIILKDEKTKLNYTYHLEEQYRVPLEGNSRKKEQLIYIAPKSNISTSLRNRSESRTDSDSSFEFISSEESEPHEKGQQCPDGSMKKTAAEFDDGMKDIVFQSVKAEMKVGEHVNLQTMKDLLLHAGIKVKLNYGKSKNVFCIEGSISEINKAEELLEGNQIGKKAPPIKRLSSHGEKNPSMADSVIPLGNTDFKTFEFFAMKEEWFSSKRNMIKEKDNTIVLSHGMQSSVKEQIERLLKKIHGMQREEIEVTKDEYSKAEAAVESLKQKEDMKDVYFERRKKGIIIVSEGYDEMSKAKHKVNLALGRIKETKGRKERQFGTGPIDSQETAQTEQPAAGKPRGKRDFSNLDVEKTDAGSSISSSYGASSGKGSFLTKEGIVVKVYCDSITKLNVDCIVNAANESLSHGAGVAYAISRAAGRELDQEGSAYVQTYGKIEVGKCCVTKAGNLNYDCVIHTVGPRWNDYNDKRQCLRLLREAVLVTFGEASKRKLRSIAVPAISSGIFAVPKMRCVEQYFKAVEEYCKTSGRTSSLKEIHFVDKDEEMVKLIQEQFATYNWDFSSPGNSSHVNNVQERGNLSGSLRSSAKSVELKYSEKTAESSPIITTDEKSQLGVSDYDEYHYNNLKVFLYRADICATKVDMVVCPQDPEFREKGRIAQAICRSYVELHSEDDWRKLRGTRGICGSVKSLKVKSEACHWNYVAHAVPPRYFKDKSKNYYYTDHLKATVKDIFREMKIEGCKSVGIPVLGAAELGAETPLPIVADCFSTEIQRFGDHLFSADTYNIHIIYYNDDQHKAFDDEFSRKFQKVQKPLAPPEDVEMRDVMDEQVQEPSENCSICMDPPTNAKTLRCGHTFCTDCINQYLEGYKAACPNCGMIFGRLTGDQPDGKISISRNHYVHLPGYDAYGTIVVTYSFPDGEQGADHPNPGKPYKGVSRSGNLPDNTEGKLVAKLLNVAFSRRLIFTIGRSRTSGQDGVLTWNDIHHKTRTHGGPDRFGYPDKTYLERVLDELSAKGVTKESADNPEEYAEYTRVFGKW